jgi:hypothetical protein
MKRGVMPAMRLHYPSGRTEVPGKALAGGGGGSPSAEAPAVDVFLPVVALSPPHRRPNHQWLISVFVL